MMPTPDPRLIPVLEAAQALREKIDEYQAKGMPEPGIAVTSVLRDLIECLIEHGDLPVVLSMEHVPADVVWYFEAELHAVAADEQMDDEEPMEVYETEACTVDQIRREGYRPALVMCP